MKNKLCLLDYSQIVISSSVDYSAKTKDDIQIPLLRHIALSSILKYKKKFNLAFNEMIICYDGRDYWRKSIFPHYKQNRKMLHEKSSFDWNYFYECFNTIKNEIKDHLPFKSLEVMRV